MRKIILQEASIYSAKQTLWNERKKKEVFCDEDNIPYEE